MKRYMVVAAMVFLMPGGALADGSDLHGSWDMTSMHGQSLEDIDGRYRYTFSSDGVLVTETPFATYDGTWEATGAGRISFDLMSARPGAATNECAFSVADDAMALSDCANGSPPATFIRAQ